jgi:hypothetical protein
MTVKLRIAALAGAGVLGVAGIAVSTPPVVAAGSGYWVDSTSAVCSDLGGGAQAVPFCTISAAAKKAIAPGDTVHVAPGTYREQVTVAGSGTPVDPITFVADAPGVVILGTQDLSGATWAATNGSAWSTGFAPPSAPRQVYLDGSRLSQAASATGTTPGSWFYDATAKVLYVDAGGSANPAAGHQIEAGAQSFGVTATARSNLVISGFTARWQNLAGFRALTSSTVTFDRVSAVGSAVNGVLLDGCTAGAVVSGASISGSLSTGIKLNNTTGARVSGSTSRDNSLHGIGLANSPSNTIAGNTTYANASASLTATAVGIDVNTGSTDNVITSNVSHGNQDSGIQVYAGSHRALVARNIVYSNGDHGLDTLNSTGVRYLNNTSYRNHRDGLSIEGTSTGATSVNNILLDNGVDTNEFDLYVDPGSASGFTGDRDVVYNHATQAPIKVAGTTYKRLVDYVAATGQEAHGLARAPAFVAPGSADFHLQGGSPAVDSGDSSATGFTAVDPEGHGPADDPIVPDTGTGSPAYADRGALEFQPDGTVADYAPHSALVVDPAAVAVPPAATVTADGSGSGDADVHPIASYSFDFGDGTMPVTQTTPIASHAYRGTGTFTVTLVVTDDAGLTDTARADVDVTGRSLQTYRVEQTAAACSDGGNGTSVVPFCSIGAALKKALSGDTVLVGAGQYREQVTPTGASDPDVPLTLQGSPGAVVLGSDDLSDAGGWSATGTTAWIHTFTPVAAPTQVWVDNVALVQAASAGTTTPNSWFYDATARQLYVDTGGANPAVGHAVSAAARNFGLLVRNQTNIAISGLAVRQTNLIGVFVDSSDRVALSGLTVSQAGSHGVSIERSTGASVSDVTSSGNASIGIRFNDSSASTLTRASTHDNLFHGVSLQHSRQIVVSDVTSFGNLRPGTRVAAGIDVSLGSVDCIVQDSTVHHNDDSGLEAYTASTGTVFRRNVSYDNGDHGIDNFQATGSVVVANTVVGNATAGINFEGGSTSGTTRDNIASDNAIGSTRTIGEIRIDEASAAGGSYNRDLVFHTGGGPLFEWASQPYTTVASFQAVSGQEPDGLSGSPTFVNVAGRDLRLASTSPAIDAAFTGITAWKSRDHDQNVPMDDPSRADTGNGPDSYADLGAFEYGGPAALGTVSPTTGLAPLAVQVNGTASVGLTAPLAAYRWACGNGTTLTTANGTCTYATAGVFTPMLTVTDTAGRSDTWSGTVTVTADAPPVAALKATPTSGYAPQAVVLDASASTDTDSTPIASFTFNCGNGQTGAAQPGPTFSCTYPKSGTFTASVVVRDSAGLSSTRSLTVKILADAAPNAVLSLSDTSITRGSSVGADGSASTDVDNTPIASYRFDCGNGMRTAEQSSPRTTCTYPTTGKFTIQLWVTDTAQLTRSVTKSVRVR